MKALMPCFLQYKLCSHAACADRDAQVLDFIQFNRRAALNSSLKHSACSYLPPKDAVTADEAIHVYPFDLSPQCEVSKAQQLKGRHHSSCIVLLCMFRPCGHMMCGHRDGWNSQLTALLFEGLSYAQNLQNCVCVTTFCACWHHAGHATAGISTPQPLPAERPQHEPQAAVQGACAGAGVTGSAGAGC